MNALLLLSMLLLPLSAFAQKGDSIQCERHSLPPTTASCPEIKASYTNGTDSLCEWIERNLHIGEHHKVAANVPKERKHRKRKAKDASAESNLQGLYQLSIHITNTNPHTESKGEIDYTIQHLRAHGIRPPVIITDRETFGGQVIVHFMIGTDGMVSDVSLSDSRRNATYTNPAQDSFVQQLETQLLYLLQRTTGQWSPAERACKPISTQVCLLIKWTYTSYNTFV